MLDKPNSLLEKALADEAEIKKKLEEDMAEEGVTSEDVRKAKNSDLIDALAKGEAERERNIANFRREEIQQENNELREMMEAKAKLTAPTTDKESLPIPSTSSSTRNTSQVLSTHKRKPGPRPGQSRASCWSKPRNLSPEKSRGGEEADDEHTGPASPGSPPQEHKMGDNCGVGVFRPSGC
ncbi:hypothetical protein MGG_05444 [Pyricularia oryzae 70-15]|uniref:Uncharacterized protein n=2 Tax=Pyricularia oryzae TaxID=318829 RepID=G4MLR4_PYRO7|nr:uncharacterized protein MGG_05444 [Pyricularia oryzae 70-15]EHA57692.1 hypothetical protein MGG_05444 [Pyricularia oryzae 70-15]